MIIKSFFETIRNMQFENVDDLFNRKEQIRENYFMLEKEEKIMYKWYFFYQLSLLRRPLKSLFWSYINSQTIDVFLLSELNKKYQSFCDYRNKLRTQYLTERVNK